jgi:hypothetical protein
MMILFISAILMIFFMLFSFFIPKKWCVKEMVYLKIPSDDLYELLLYVKNWPQWQMDEHAVIPIMYVGPEKGEGASQYWESDGVPACLRIDRCEPGKSIHYQMRINKGETVLRFGILFSDEQNSTKLTWMCEGTSSKNPFERYITFFYKWMMRREMKVAVVRLKKLMDARLKELKQPA